MNVLDLEKKYLSGVINTLNVFCRMGCSGKYVQNI